MCTACRPWSCICTFSLRTCIEDISRFAGFGPYAGHPPLRRLAHDDIPCSPKRTAARPSLAIRFARKRSCKPNKTCAKSMCAGAQQGCGCMVSSRKFAQQPNGEGWLIRTRRGGTWGQQRHQLWDRRNSSTQCPSGSNSGDTQWKQ